MLYQKEIGKEFVMPQRTSIWSQAHTTVIAAISFGFVASLAGLIVFESASFGCMLAAAGLVLYAFWSAWQNNLEVSYLGLCVVLFLFFVGYGAFLLVLKLALFF